MILTFGLSADLKQMVIDPSELPEGPIGFIQPQGSKKIEAKYKDIYQLNRYKDRNQYVSCISSAKKMWSSREDLRPWILGVQLDCADEYFERKGKEKPLLEALAKAESNKGWLSLGAFSGSLKSSYIKAKVDLFERLVDRSSDKAWDHFENIVEVETLMSESQAQEFYFLAAELAQKTQDEPLALDFFSKSLLIDPSDEKKREIKKAANAQVRKLLSEKFRIEKEKKVKSDPEDENKYAQFARARGRGRLNKMAKLGVEYLNDFPAGKYASRVERDLSRQWRRYARRDSERAKKQIKNFIEAFKKLKGSVAVSMVETASYFSEYEPARGLAQSSWRNADLDEQKRLLYLWGESSHFLGDYKDAIKAFSQLKKSYSQSEIAFEASHFLGISYLRLKKFKQAKKEFKDLLARTDEARFRLNSLYFLWQIGRLQNDKSATTYGLNLIEEYPLTYYGLRARKELRPESKPWSEKAEVKSQVKVSCAQVECQAWRRLKSFMGAGLWREARAEVDHLPESETLDYRVIKAKLYANALAYNKSIMEMNKVWDESDSYRAENLVREIYPQPYNKWVQKYSQAHSMDYHLINSLIRQESSFRHDVRSPAGALGLMQLITPTARDMTRALGLRLRLPSALRDPYINVRLGTKYFRRLLGAFDGHVPMTLAAYNGGIGRIRRWQKHREETRQIEEIASSDFMSELWIEELPKPETKYYVKSVMRNWMIYRLLEPDLGWPREEPLWKTALLQP